MFRKLQPGYFMLEVILALGVASLVIYGVFALASGALSVSETMAEEGRGQITRETFLTFLGRNLEMLPGNAVVDLQSEDMGSHYTSELTFQNVPTSFSWAGQALSAEAIQLAAVLRRDGDLDIVLRYYEEPILDDEDSTANVRADPVAEITLLRDVWRFEWKVLDGRTMEWDYVWDVRGRMPLQLELNVVFNRNGEEIIHYFWIPPKTSPATLMRAMQTSGDRAGTQAQPGQQPPNDNPRGGGGTRGDNPNPPVPGGGAGTRDNGGNRGGGNAPPIPGRGGR
ncbi:MAG: hypothetical protein HKN82_15360 [Akkermansiaceae bacterium]|nr:hypothetical protein [Akkermansiaceae bacterium]NNM30226.1 hypothetical protein [Akkermansiaceae bacterium]